MQSDVRKSLIVFIGWLIRASFQLDCIQCTSPIRRLSQSWDHSCLDGNLTPLPCRDEINESNSTFKQCYSSLYRVGQRGRAGVLIHRGCTKVIDAQHGCDPAEPLIDFESSSRFYCHHTCEYDGCNRHSVKEISSNGNRLSKKKLIVMRIYIISMIILLFSAKNFFS